MNVHFDETCLFICQQQVYRLVKSSFRLLKTAWKASILWKLDESKGPISSFWLCPLFSDNDIKIDKIINDREDHFIYSRLDTHFFSSGVGLFAPKHLIIAIWNKRFKVAAVSPQKIFLLSFCSF